VQIIAAIGGLSFIVASLATGARLLLVARRTPELPEFVLGLGQFLMGGVGYPMTLLGELGTFLPDAARAASIAGNQLSTVVGLTLFAFFSARVFRPESRWAWAGVWILGLGFFGLFAYRAATVGFAPVALGGVQPMVGHSILTVVALGWAGAESLSYQGRLHKRVQLGLADPILANRMGLWALGMLCAMLLTGIASTFGALGIPFNETTAGILTIGVMGSTSALSIWFAFFPPDAYVRWVRSGA
jgi:hypothetical protein